MGSSLFTAELDVTLNMPEDLPQEAFALCGGIVDPCPWLKGKAFTRTQGSPRWLGRIFISDRRVSTPEVVALADSWKAVLPDLPELVVLANTMPTAVDKRPLVALGPVRKPETPVYSFLQRWHGQINASVSSGSTETWAIDCRFLLLFAAPT